MNSPRLCLAFLLLGGFAVVAVSSEALGEAGCSNWESKPNHPNPDGFCWRYCSGGAGDWCYTGTGCKGSEGQCAAKRECITCNGVGGGCVETCPNRDYADPEGGTGCSKQVWSGHPNPDGHCWRYCSGSKGDWCYTGTGCKGDESSCSEKTACISCKGVGGGCVDYCPVRDVSVTPEPDSPSGATACAGPVKWKADGGRCWRYCSGTNGPWCYTGDHCLDNQEMCATKATCGAHTCAGAMEGCVETCPEEESPDMVYVTYSYTLPE